MELTRTLELPVDPQNDIWDEFEVTFDWIPFTPAYLGGLPEDCYPAEGNEIEIQSIVLTGQENTVCTDDFDHDYVENLLWEAEFMWTPEQDFGDY